MRGLGRHKRRVREFLGLSQEQLARMAGVSQGAISRLEAGRGLATPLLVVMKINGALKREFDQFDPALLSEEARKLRESDDRMAPESTGGGFEEVPLLRDSGLEELINLYHGLPERQRQKLLAVVRATSGALGEG
jgi:transcriptional regulator with XRE-family HTH domain